MPLAHGIERLSIYLASGAKTVVQLNDLDAPNSEIEGPRAAENDQQNATGGQYFGGDFSRFRIRGKEESGAYAQLRTWQKADTRLNAAIQGANFNLQWYELDAINLLKWVDIMGRAVGRADFFDVEMLREGHGEHSIHRQVNLVAHLSDASGTSYDQTIVFPVAGCTITAAVTDTGAGGTLTVTAEDKDGTSLASDNVSLSAGRESVELTLPASTYQVQITVASGTSISDLSVRTDGETTYLAY